MNDDRQRKPVDPLGILELTKSPDFLKQHLPTIWQRVRSEVVGEARLRNLTTRELSQLKRFKQLVGHEAPAVLEHTIRHWSSFREEAWTRKGLRLIPFEPEIAFLTLCAELALHEYRRYQKSVAAPKVGKAKRIREEPSKKAMLKEVAAIVHLMTRAEFAVFADEWDRLIAEKTAEVSS